MLPMHGGRGRHTRPVSSLRAAGIVFFVLLVGAIGLAGFYLRQSQIIVGDLKDEVLALKGAQAVAEALSVVAATNLAESSEKAVRLDQSQAKLQVELAKQATQLKELAAEKVATLAAHGEERKQLESQIQSAQAAKDAAEAGAAHSASVALDATQALILANKNMRAAGRVASTGDISGVASTQGSNATSRSGAAGLPGTPADIVAAQAAALSLSPGSGGTSQPQQAGTTGLRASNQSTAGGASKVVLDVQEVPETRGAPSGTGQSKITSDLRPAGDVGSREEGAARQGVAGAGDSAISKGRPSSGTVLSKLVKDVEKKGQDAEVATAQGSAGTAVMLANERQATGGSVVH